MPVVPWVKKQGLFDAQVLAAHCVHVDEGEMRTLRNAGAGVAHNPSSNLKLGSGIAPVTKMLDLGLKVGIGTDGPASNNDLDMFEEIRLAALLAKGTTGEPHRAARAAGAADGHAARRARRCGLGDITGSLEPGKRADLIVVDLDAAPQHAAVRPRPRRASTRSIVYAAKSTDVTDVMCNGRWLMRDRRAADARRRGAAPTARASTRRRIDAFLIAREESVLQKLIAIGGAREEESFEVQVKAPLASDETGAGGASTAASSRSSRRVRYHQYDTYFSFADPSHGRLRYREDEFLDEKGAVDARARAADAASAPRARRSSARCCCSARATSRRPPTRAASTASTSGPSSERDVEKHRRRWLVAYKGVEFYVHLDKLTQPALPGYFLEIKSRTWSRRDAHDKAAVITELMQKFGATPAEAFGDGYVDFEVRRAPLTRGRLACAIRARLDTPAALRYSRDCSLPHCGIFAAGPCAGRPGAVTTARPRSAP